MNRLGYKLKQLTIPMELYGRILKRCGEEQDTNETRVMLRLMENGLKTPPEVQDIEVVSPLLPDDDGDSGLPEVTRLRKIFPNNEPEVQRQLKEIEIGLRQMGETEDNIRLILFGSEGKNE